MTATRPLYQKTAETLMRMLQGSQPGSNLPSEPALAKSLGVSRATLREAMRLLEERGWVVRRQGVGTFVAEPHPVIEAGLEVLVSLERLADQIGLRTEMAMLDIQARPASAEEAQILGLDPGQQVHEVSRLMQADGRPVAYLVDVLPVSLLPIDQFGSGFRGSVLDLLLRQGRPERDCSRTQISAIAAPAELARRMRISPGSVLLTMQASLYTKQGQVVARSFSYFLPETFRFHVLRRVAGFSL